MSKACLFSRGSLTYLLLTHDFDCDSYAPSKILDEQQRPTCLRATGCSSAFKRDTRAFISVISQAAGQSKVMWQQDDP